MFCHLNFIILGYFKWKDEEIGQILVLHSVRYSFREWLSEWYICISKHTTDNWSNAFWLAHDAGVGQIVIPSTCNAIAYLPSFVPLLLRYCHNNHFDCAWNICHDAIIFYSSFPICFLYFYIKFSKIAWVEKLFLEMKAPQFFISSCHNITCVCAFAFIALLAVSGIGTLTICPSLVLFYCHICREWKMFSVPMLQSNIFRVILKEHIWKSECRDPPL